MRENTQNITYITIKIHNLHNSTAAYKTYNKIIQNIQLHRLIWEVLAVPRLCELYPGIWLTTEEKAWKNLN
jgi:hypothetical protein